MEAPVFRSRLEETMPAVELDFPPTPAFGDYRPYLDHAVCFDAETEILTIEGWKRYNELREGMLVATLNSDGELEYQPIQQIIVMHYKGKMYRLKTKALDILVTPNHKLYVDVGDRGAFRLREAQEVFGMNKAFKRDAKWNGTEPDAFVLPRAEIKWRNSSRMKVYEEKRVPMDVWVKFFGLWLAEGSTSNTARSYRSYSVRITNKNATVLQEMVGLLKPFFAVKIRGKDLIINDKQLYLYLKQFGHAEDKWVPLEIKKLSPPLLRMFLEYYLKGDGYIRFQKNGKRPRITAYTISKRLADDLMEIALKAGMCATIQIRNRIGRKSISQDGKEFVTRNVEYVVTFSWQNTPYVQTRHKNNIEEWVDYDGIVWCVTVPNHVVYVRRNGKPIWSGNSHPAKANMKLLEFLVLKYTKEGDVILDPMAGSGSTGVVAALHGRDAILVDIEPRYYEFMVKAKEKVERVQSLLGKGRITCILGDARELSRLLGRIDTCITSPPYGDTNLSGGDVEKRVERLVRLGYDPREFVHGRAANTVLRHYGESEDGGNGGGLADSEGNIGNLPLGPVDAVVTSPPYTNTACDDPEGITKYRKGGAFAEEKLGGSAYGENNIANLPMGPEGAIASEEGGSVRAEDEDVHRLYMRLLAWAGRPTYLSEMLLVYHQMYKVLREGGRAIVIVKPFSKGKRVVDLPYITYILMSNVGFALEALYKLRLKQQSFWRTLYYRKNPDVPRIMHEYVLVCVKPVSS